MAHVAGFDHDVFVAFADEDNAILPGAAEGWIDQFIGCLTTLLKQKGIPDPAVHAFLQGHLPSAARLEKLKASAAVVVVLSPAYLESSWCKQETSRDIMRSVGQARPENIFVVEKAYVAREHAADYDGFRHDTFWRAERESARTLGVPDLKRSGDTDAYYAAANDLASAMTARLKKLHHPSPPLLANLPPATTRIYLAEVTRDVEERRCEVQRYLEQAGFEVIPRGRLPLEPQRFDAEVSTLVESCRAFVQLLGDGPHRDDPTLGRVYQQIEIARRSADQGPTILQWRDPMLDVYKVVDPRLRELLLRDTVRAETISEFCQAVKTAATRPKPADPVLPTVFVDVHREQIADVQRIFSRYSTVRWDWHEPKLTALKKILRLVHGVVLYWGDGDSDRTQERYYLFQGHFKALKKDLGKLLIYDGPPPHKPRFSGVGFPIAEARDGNEPYLFRRFLQEIENAAG